MAATYSLNGGANVEIPGGIFTVPSDFTLDVKSTSIANTGVYTITLTVKDTLPASVIQKFTLKITNAVPRVVSIPPNVSLIHGKSISIPLASYFKDDDGDQITMTATSSFNRGPTLAIPTRIITMPSPFTIDVTSTSIRDTGTYIITLTVKDALPSQVIQAFTLIISNSAPKVVQIPPNLQMIHGRTLSVPLASYFIDDDGDILTMTATSSYNGGAAVALPNGILKIPSDFTIDLISTSILDTGTYTITLTVKDALPSQVIQAFTVTITNDRPRVVSTPTNLLMIHGRKLAMPLSAYFIDDDGDSLTITSASYSLNGKAAISIPVGIFTLSNPLTIDAKSVGLIDVGSYIISVTVSDSLSAIITSYTLDITNTSPRVVSIPTSIIASQNFIASMSLSSNFFDDDGDPMTVTATYSFNGGKEEVIPGGIFKHPSQFMIEANPTSVKNVGTYRISLIVSDTVLYVSSSYEMTVVNTPPRLTRTIPNQIVSVNSIGSYDLSEFFVDDDRNPLAMTATSSYEGQAALSLSNGILTQKGFIVAIAPTQMAELGIYLISVTVSDTIAKISSSFEISVVNSPPYFLSAVPSDFTMIFNNTYDFYLPNFNDDEGNAVTIVLDSIPAGMVDFATIIDQEYIEFKPQFWSKFKDYDLYIQLTDGNMWSVPYRFKLIMTNSAPSFQTKLPSVQRVQLSKEFNLALPAVIDMENNPTQVIIIQKPSFTNYESQLNSFVIKPTNPATDLGIFMIKGKISDSRLSNDFSFKVEVYNTPPRIKDKISDITIQLRKQLTYTLPTIEDEEGLPIKIQPQLPLPAFVQYDPVSTTFMFSPNKTKDLGRETISFCFTDGYSPEQCESFGVKVEDPNKPKNQNQQQLKHNSGKIIQIEHTEKFKIFQAKLLIQEVTRDGRATLKLVGGNGKTGHLAIQVTNDTFSIRLHRGDEVRYEVKSIIQEISTVEIQLFFANPSNVSNQIVSYVNQ